MYVGRWRVCSVSGIYVLLPGMFECMVCVWLYMYVYKFVCSFLVCEYVEVEVLVSKGRVGEHFGEPGLRWLPFPLSLCSLPSPAFLASLLLSRPVSQVALTHFSTLLCT